MDKIHGETPILEVANEVVECVFEFREYEEPLVGLVEEALLMQKRP